VRCWVELGAWLSFGVIRAMHLCLRGLRVCRRSGMGIDDGAGLPAVLSKYSVFFH